MKENSDASSQSGEPSPERGEAIFYGALQLSPEQRAAYLDQACGSDAQLRQRVENLLKADGEAGDFLDKPIAPLPEKTLVVSIPVTEKPGDTIGRYKLLQQIGEGGCGVVYMAEQEQPVRRRVALKVIKLGMDTKSVIARFEAERQALALMDHPNIARVLDAGATETGRPYFVMELVRGIKITDYCDQNKLSMADRLRLFMQVCHAIQHAHQKGIIHRDIKPSNILVTLHDGVPVPKVIDFGIAKATQGRLTDQTLFTAFEQFIGTPAYMSPEQAEMSGLDIDTRCDVYALGVLLYELLTGQTPFDARELLASGLDKMRHTIREKEPDRPSTRLSTMLNADLATMASDRRTDAPKLIHLLRGDLDWIVMKTLEKDRTRRYETANALATDIQRYVENEPVLARPPSSLYRLQKLVRRNKATVAAVAGVMAALAIGFGISLFLFVRENAAYKRAVAAEREQARLRQQAEESAKLGAMLNQAGLMISREQYAEAERILKQIGPNPASSSIFNVLGILRARRGEYPLAVPNFTRVIELVPNDHDAYHSLAPLLAFTGDKETYRSLCSKMIEKFGKTYNPAIAERTGRDCLILPPPASELPAISRLADVAIGAGPEHKSWPYFEFVKGLAEYRRGHYANAVEWLRKVPTTGGDRIRAAATFLVLAMAQHQLKQEDEARAMLAKGLSICESNPAQLHGPQWNDEMAAQVLMREASELIQGGAAAQDAAK